MVGSVRLPASESSFIPAIAGLRGIAVLLVLLNHFNTVAFSHWFVGNTGVAIFFSISGFLVYYVLRRDEQRWGRISYGYFIARRILRIWPLYFFVIGLVYFTERHFGNIQQVPLSLFLFIFNFDLVGGHHPALTPLSILWSISVEEQFYVLAPLMYWVLRSRYCTIFCVAIFVGANLLRWFYLANVPAPVGGGMYYATFAYADTFLAGALLAHLWTGTSAPRTTEPLLAWGSFGAAVVLLVVATRVWAFGPSSPLAFLPYFLIPFAGSLLIWSLIAAPTAVSAFLSSRPMRAIGTLSFGIYATHTYMQNYLYQHIRPGVPIFSEYGVVVYNLGTMGCTVLLAAILYFAVERPALRLKRSFEPRSANRRAAATSPVR